MDELLKLMKRLAPEEGFNETLVPGVKIFKATQYQPRQPLCYSQGAIIMGQGTKRIFLGGKMYEYNPDNYLVLSVPLPAECETFASEEAPLLSIAIDFDVSVINKIVGQMDQHIDHSLLRKKANLQGLFVSETTDEIKDAVLRLLKALQMPLDSRVLGTNIVQELLFRIMCRENASSLYALSMQNTNLARVDKALKQIHGNYTESIDVETLSGIVNMSPSAFHRAFKEVTACSPIQYLKKIRLDKARTLLIEKGLRVNEAAMEVGYESATQFSREFKRYFGDSPVAYKASNINL